MKRYNHSDPAIFEVITGLGIGGAERLAAELTLEIAQQGANIRLIAITDDTRILAQYPRLSEYTTVLGLTKNPFKYLGALVRLHRLVNSSKNAVVHAHMFHALLAIVPLKLLNPRIGIVFTSHSYAGFSRFRTLFLRLTKRLRAADIIFAPDQHVGMNAATTHVIPNFAPRITAVDAGVRRPCASGQPLTFAFVGRMIPTKNPLAIIRAFRDMGSDSAQLLLVGGGGLETDAAAYVRELGLGDRVRILGPRNDVPAILSAVDVLVLASHWEGLPMTLLEAGSRGIPVVAPPVGAIPHLLAGDCGYLCLPTDLTQTMRQITENPLEAASRGERLRQKIQQEYSIDTATAQHLAVYAATHGC